VRWQLKQNSGLLYCDRSKGASVSTLEKVMTIAFSVYALITVIFLVSENRRPQATLAWALAFFFMPGLGVLIYILFGKDWKAFSKQRQLLLQDLKGNAYPLLSPMIEGQDQVIVRLEAQGPTHRKLMMLVRHNSRSVLTGRNTVEILQDACTFYPRLMEDLQAARHSIHLQYWTILPNRSKRFSLRKYAQE